MFYSQSKIKLYQNYKSLFYFIKLNLSGQLAIDHDFRLATGILPQLTKRYLPTFKRLWAQITRLKLIIIESTDCPDLEPLFPVHASQVKLQNFSSVWAPFNYSDPPLWVTKFV